MLNEGILEADKLNIDVQLLPPVYPQDNFCFLLNEGILEADKLNINIQLLPPVYPQETLLESLTNVRTASAKCRHMPNMLAGERFVIL